MVARSTKRSERPPVTRSLTGEALETTRLDSDVAGGNRLVQVRGSGATHHPTAIG